MAEEQPPPPVDPTLGAIVPGAPPTPPMPFGAIQVEPPTMPAIALDPSKEPRGKSNPIPKTPNKDSEVKDTTRELMETVVFVVVLVLMLKTFLAEAFVIPTGSMADSLLGYHYKVPCTQCGYRNLVNASSEAEPTRGEIWYIHSSECQNCGETNVIRPVPHRQPPGDRQ